MKIKFNLIFKLILFIIKLSYFLLLKIKPFQKNLSIYQWNLINSITKNPSTPRYMKEKISQIIYTKYETWAIYKAYQFKFFHKYKCRNINIQDLILFSLEGLKKATLNYNGKYSFYNYANIYISGELYKGLTYLQPITSIPKTVRKKKITNFKNNYRYSYKKIMNTLFISNNDYWMFEKRQNKLELFTLYNYKELWDIIEFELNPISKKIIYYKYDFYFKKINSNKKIGELIGCSEETIRTHLKKILLSKKNLLQNYCNVFQYENALL